MKLRVLALVLAARRLWRQQDRREPTKQARRSAKPYVQPKDAPDGLDLRLSDGKQGPPAFDTRSSRRRRSSATPTSQQLLARAEPLKAEPDDQQAFALRPTSTAAAAHRQHDQGRRSRRRRRRCCRRRANDTGKDLRVLRYMPEGEVPLAPELIGDVHPADGRGDVARRRREDAAGEADAAAEGQVAVDRHAHDPVRSRGSRFPQATTYTGRDSRRHEERDRRRAQGGRRSSRSRRRRRRSSRSIPSELHAAAPRRADVRDVRSEDRSAGGARVKLQVTGDAERAGTAKPLATAHARSRQGDRASDKQLSRARRRREEGRARRPLARVPHGRSSCRPTRRSPSRFPTGTPSAEGPNKTKDGADVLVPHVSAAASSRTTCGYDRDVPAGHARCRFRFNNPLDEDKFDEKLGHGHARRSRACSVDRSSGHDGRGRRPDEGAHDVQGHDREGAHRRVRADARQRRDAHVQGRRRVPDVLRAERHGRARSGGARSRRSTSSRRTTTRSRSSSTRSSRATCRRTATTVENQWNQDHPPAMPGTKVFDSAREDAGRQERARRDAHRSRARADKAGFGHVDRDRRAVSVEGDVRSAAHDRVGAVDASSRSTRTSTATTSSRSRPSSAPASRVGGVDARDPAVRHQRRRPTARASRRCRSPTSAERRALSARDAAATTSRSSPRTTTGATTAAGTSSRARRSSPGTSIDDRKLYKPGEEVSLKGWLRTIDYGKNGDVGGSTATVEQVTYKVIDCSRQRDRARARRRSIAVGGFDTKFTLPKTPNLGYANVDVRGDRAMPATTRTRSRSRSSAGPSSRCRRTRATGPFVVGGGGDVTVDAKYFAGGAAARRAGQLVRHREPDLVHAAEPRRLRVRPVDAVVGLSRLVRRRRR